MKKTIAVFVMVVMFLLSGCNSNNSLTGSKWTITTEGITITRQFNDDGTTIEWINNKIRSDGVYTISGNEISATMTSFTNEESGKKVDFLEAVNWRWSYSVDGNKLTLIDLNLDDNEEVIYTRE